MVNLDEDGDGVGEVATGDKTDCAWPAKHRQTLFVVGDDDVGNDAEAIHDDDEEEEKEETFSIVATSFPHRLWLVASSEDSSSLKKVILSRPLSVCFLFRT